MRTGMLLLHYVFRISKSCPLVVDFLRAISLGLRPALSFLGLAGPRPETPRDLECQTRPAPPPKRRGPASGSPRRAPVLDTIIYFHPEFGNIYYHLVHVVVECPLVFTLAKILFILYFEAVLCYF